MQNITSPTNFATSPAGAVATDAIPAAWAMQADELADHFERFANRRDVWGGYLPMKYRKENRKKDGGTFIQKTTTKPAKTKRGKITLSRDILARSFAGRSKGDIAGLHTTSPNNTSTFVVIDIDLHGDTGSVEKNLAAAIFLFAFLVGLGFRPLLLDSDGKGGFHLWVFFSTPIATATAYRFGKWIAGQYKAAGLDTAPESFPKQPGIDPEKEFGNWVRLPGAHHTRDHWARVWDGVVWLSGKDAIDHILTIAGDAPDMLDNFDLPEIEDDPKKKQKKKKRQRMTPAIVAACLDHIPNAEAGLEYDAWFTIGGAVHHETNGSEAGFELFNKWSKHSLKYSEDETRRAWENYKRATGKVATGGTLVKLARDSGYDPFTEENVIDYPEPLRLAEHFLDREHTDDQGRLLLARWRQAYWRFQQPQCRYEAIEDEHLSAGIYQHTDKLWERKRDSEGNDTGELVKIVPRASLTREINLAIPACGTLVNGEMPQWRTPNASPAANLIAFRNGLLDVEKYRTGDASLIPPTPDWFSAVALPFDFDGTATCPQTLKFLGQAFEDDSESIDLFQEWAGYLTVPNNSHEKLMMLVGQPGSGKGTSMTILENMLGSDQVGITTFTKLATRFGLAPLVGKLAAFLPDAHIGRTTDDKAALEVLKSVTGNDPQAIDQKHIAELPRVRMRVRFVIGVNELPKLPDDAGALKRRLLLLHYPVSFAADPDTGLKARLAAEAPGFAVWAIEGLIRLREQGSFTMPKKSQIIIDEFERLVSPVKCFAAERCEVVAGQYIEKARLFDAWVLWCKARGDEPGNLAHFGQSLINAFPAISAGKRGPSGSQFPVYVGVRLC